MISLIRQPRELVRKAENALARVLEYHETTKFAKRTASRSLYQNARFAASAALIAASLDQGKRYRFSTAVDLPDPAPAERAIGEILRSRRSRIGEGPVALEQISSILYHAAFHSSLQEGVQTEAGPALIYKRPYPSAGGLYPCEIYILSFDVAGLAPGIYHYDCRVHVLRKIGDGRPEDLRAAFYPAEEIRKVGAAVIITGSLRRATEKYLDRAYRFCLLEAGHLSQNICLAAEAQAVLASVYGGFYDQDVVNLLSIKDRSEVALSSVLVSGAT